MLRSTIFVSSFARQSHNWILCTFNMPSNHCPIKENCPFPSILTVHIFFVFSFSLSSFSLLLGLRSAAEMVKKKRKSSDANSNNGKTIDLAMIPNLNWLIHMAFARQDYKYCNEVIEYQFSETYDHEYLYYIKVKCRSRNTNIRIASRHYLLRALLARPFVRPSVQLLAFFSLSLRNAISSSHHLCMPFWYGNVQFTYKVACVCAIAMHCESADGKLNWFIERRAQTECSKC